MNHWYAKPNEQLAEAVRTVLIIEGFSKAGFNRQPVYIGGMPILFCRTEKKDDSIENITELSLFGVSPNDICTPNKNSTIIAYFFQPFTVASLFNIPAARLTGKPYDLSTWNSKKYSELKKQLIETTETQRKIEVLDNFLISQLNENQRIYNIIQYAANQIMCNSNKEILNEILEELDLKERTFQRIFKRFVGVPPTQYRRICQYQVSFEQLHSKKFNTLSEVAYDNGYADQSHFIRSFKDFAIITPAEYIKKGLKKQ